MNLHPELRVFSSPGYVEYRVENWYISRDGTGRVIRGNTLTWSDGLLVAFLAFIWSQSQGKLIYGVPAIIAALVFVYLKCNTVLWESIIAIPPHGVQLETHKGLPSFPLFASRRFIPLTAIKELIINEGLRRWDVRYYMAILVREPSGDFSLAVAYGHILPHFPVLLEVYHGLQQALFLSPEPPAVCDDPS